MIIPNRNKWLSLAFCGFLLVAVAPTFAQDSQQSGSAPLVDLTSALEDQAPPDVVQAPAPGSAGERCWQQAGISKETMKLRKTIMENAKSQIQQVYQDSSLTPQQQRQQVREIHRKAKTQAEETITPEQRQALQQCQLDRRNAAEQQNSSAPPAPAVPTK